MAELLNNQDFVWGAMAIIILCLSQAFKLPLKALTKHTIADDNVRARVNTALMLIPLALGVVFDFLFCTFYLKVAFSVTEGVKVGGTAVTLYGILEKLIKGAPSKETAKTLELADNVTKDGKVDKSDISAVEKFINKV